MLPNEKEALDKLLAHLDELNNNENKMLEEGLSESLPDDGSPRPIKEPTLEDVLNASRANPLKPTE